MKEIDLLPEWYKSGQRRQVSYRTQYVAIGGIFIVMIVWNCVTAHSLSKATAELRRLEPKQVQAESRSAELAKIKSEAAQLQKKADILKEIDSGIEVANILAEISYLIDERIVLREVKFDAERFADKQQSQAGKDSILRLARSGSSGKQALWLGDVRFKVVIKGVAAQAGEAAQLVCKLEDSPYFCQVMSSWRNGQIKAGPNNRAENYQVSEFEITCYIANYREM